MPGWSGKHRSRMDKRGCVSGNVFDQQTEEKWLSPLCVGSRPWAQFFLLITRVRKKAQRTFFCSSVLSLFCFTFCGAVTATISGFHTLAPLDSRSLTQDKDDTTGLPPVPSSQASFMSWELHHHSPSHS